MCIFERTPVSASVRVTLCGFVLFFPSDESIGNGDGFIVKWLKLW